jgi:hypothetical protein
VLSGSDTPIYKRVKKRKGLNISHQNMSFLSFPNFNSKTFKPQKTIKTTQQAQLNHIAETTIESGNLRLLVVLPVGEDLNEWLAINCVDF